MERDGVKCAVTGEITQVKIIRPDGDDDDYDDMFTPKSLSVYNLSNTLHTALSQ